MKEKHILYRLFLTFMKIGLFTFGGGYAMISIIENICVEKNKWITNDEMMNVTIIAESTPGPIAINCATFVGYRQAGLIGAAAATLGVTIPSFVIIFAISLFLDNFLEIAVIAHAFNGIKIGVGVLIVEAAAKMMKNMKRQWLPSVIMAASFTAMLLINLFSWSFSSISLMLIAAVVSLSIFILETKILRKGGEQK
ncbi:MAG: chromate transporter [Lachnospiraceae bacterium]|jgi:chromate transporter|nr:chromate transporter [Lachnospiraceae bacterium]